MHIEVSTDKNIDGSEGRTTYFKEVVQHALNHFDSQVTRVEVHLSDVNAGKSGPDDKHCMIEARLEGRQPTAVNHTAATLEQAVKGAADKMKNSLESTLGRLHDDH
ncbi:MAG: ribosomal subunit interface protein [Alphaproteobacteria bacterium BRH_c36]|nr:MAG: ribosomal subunit interface protein [Alphaproteobacteria bacterium BRH_c36]